jgi:hypothetical protein
MPRIAPLLSAILPVVFLSACTGVPHNKPPAKPGVEVERPPETLDEQIEFLNTRARKMPLLTAQAPLGGVIVRYPDEDGKPHRDNVDGRLWIRQHFDAQPPTADVVFYGRWSGQEILQAGKNDTTWWCILHPNGNRAWTGDVKYLSADGDSQAAILRADRVLDVLAITLIQHDDNYKITFDRTPDRKSNRVRFYRIVPADGSQPQPTTLEREILIDRRSGLPTDVTLFQEHEQMLVHARLDTYRTVDYDNPDDAPKDGKLPLMPHHIILEYPAAKSSIEMNFNDVSVPRRINPRVFETPDWQDLDIKPEVIE